MRCLLFPLIIVLLAGTAQAEPLQDMSQSELKQRLADIDARLGQLARNTLRSGVGPIGYRSYVTSDASDLTWVEIDLQASVAVDEVMLVPAIWRDSETNFSSDAFPAAFRILNEKGELLADVQTTEKDLPRIAPLIVPTYGKTASKIRIETEHLSRRAFDGKFIMQFAEVLVFSGTNNAALRRPVTSSDTAPYINPWQPQFLTDGSLPYLMHAAEGQKSIAYLSPLSRSEEVLVAPTIDLQQSVPVTGIHIHLVDQGDTVPQAAPDGIGMPRKLLIEGANHADFSDARQLLKVEAITAYETSPIMMWQLPETTCRYIRLTAIEPYLYSFRGKDFPRIGFAEIEIYSEGSNVAAGKPIQNDKTPVDQNRQLTALTDGRNIYGNILPQREWLEQLAERHELETERPLVAAGLQHHYARQKATVRIMSWLFALIAAGIIIAVLIERNIRQRAIFRTREHIAANLHDELGANLHAIGLLGDTAKKVVDQKNASEEWSDLIEIIDDVRDLTEETGSAARSCSNMLEAHGLDLNLVEEMRRTADRLLADLEHDFSVLSEDRLHRVRARRRVDLILFYKECLTNIIRHSRATVVSTQLSAEKKEISLCISDNGGGTQGEVPFSLKRRARLLGGSVTAASLTNGGTLISLSFRPRRRLPTWRVSDFIVSKLESRNRKN